MLEFYKGFPSVVKYMGSKTEVLDLIESGYNLLGKNYDYLCDLFAGSATLCGALRGRIRILSNDIQSYSSVFTKAYLSNYNWEAYPDITEIVLEAETRARDFDAFFGSLSENFNYDRDFSLEEYNEMEAEERELVNRIDFHLFDGYYLFTKDFSGTYWSYWQCVMIDSFKRVIDQYRGDDAYYNLLLTCLMYAMAYNSQSTGHYAQYRIPETESSMYDILIYRRKKLSGFFVSKYNEFVGYAREDNQFEFDTMVLSDDQCLETLPEGGVVYADPPYCFVHYSRFYHALETLVRYDYPEIRFKGRYRTDRYQSHYCIKTEVEAAFTKMFELIKLRGLDLMLSYSDSDTNTIKADEIAILMKKIFNEKQVLDKEFLKLQCDEFFSNDQLIFSFSDEKDQYGLRMIKKPYNHSRMGRTSQKTKKVTELLFLAKKNIK